MPRYKSRRKSTKERERKRVRAGMTRDKRRLMHWAVRGTHTDYAKFRKHVASISDRAPSYIQPGVMDQLAQTTRPRLLEALQKEPWGGGWVADGLAWAIDKVPDFGIAPVKWVKGLGQSQLKGFRGDALNEADEQFARLVDQGYAAVDERADQFEHWRRQAEFDSDYVSVWDNEDHERFISVRGTKAEWRDLGEDLRIAALGDPRDLVSAELRNILDHTKPGTQIDVGAHSLGTSLTLVAYENDNTLQDRVHLTHLFNPAYTPLAEGSTDRFEADDRVRYYIDLADAVSIGGVGSIGPKNVVYRSTWRGPLEAHKLRSWGGDGKEVEHDPGAAKPTEEPETVEPAESQPQIEKEEAPLLDYNNDGVPDAAVDVGDDFVVDFGDSFDEDAWDYYFGEPLMGDDPLY